MTNIFFRINRELASWIVIWRFLRALDRYGLDFYLGIDGRADSSKNEQVKKCEFKITRPRDASADETRRTWQRDQGLWVNVNELNNLSLGDRGARWEGSCLQTSQNVAGGVFYE